MFPQSKWGSRSAAAKHLSTDALQLAAMPEASPSCRPAIAMRSTMLKCSYRAP